MSGDDEARPSVSPDGPADSTTIHKENLSNINTVDLFTAQIVEDFKPDPDDDGKSCLICGHTSHGYHFGILACRACAAFFRRTVAEKKVYKCRQNCSCPIRKEMRNMCRCCRFKKCIALGMNKNDVQMNRDPIGRRKEIQTRIVECCSKSSPGVGCCGIVEKKSGSVESASESPTVTPTSVLERLAAPAVTTPLSAPLYDAATSTLMAAAAAAATRASPPMSAVSLIDSLSGSLAPTTSFALPSTSFISTMSPASIADPAISTPTTMGPLGALSSITPISTMASLAQMNAAAFTNVATLALQQQQQHHQQQQQQTVAQQQQQAAMTLLSNAAAAEYAAVQQAQAAQAAQAAAQQAAQQQAAAAAAQQMIVMPRAIKYEAPTASATPTAPTIALLPYAPPPGPSLLQRMHEGYANYQSSQKSLYTVMNPDNIFAAESYRLVKHSEHVKMERGCLSLMYSMVNDWFQPFDTLAHDLKVSVLRAFSSTFSHLDQCYKTMHTFPELDDPRFVLHYGQYIDANKLEYFFQEDKDPAASARVCQEVNIRCRNLTNKMRKLQIREIEVAALAGVILWNEVALAAAQYDGTDKIRDRIYSELHSNIILTYGVTETGSRMGSLLCLLHDLNVIAKEISESVIIGKIFNPHSVDLWEES